MFAINDAGRELDFVIQDEQRELGAFSLADHWLQGEENLLLSLDNDEISRQCQGVNIPRCNLVRWLLGV